MLHLSSRSVAVKLEETAQLIGDLQKAQNERLRLPTQPIPPHAPQPSDEELRLADRITENLTELAKSVPPGNIVSEEALRKAMGVDLESATFKYGIPEVQLPPEPQMLGIGNVVVDSSSMEFMEVAETVDIKPEGLLIKPEGLLIDID